MAVLKNFENRVVGRASNWGGFLAVVGATYTSAAGIIAWAAKKLTRFGPIEWPEAVFIGLSVATALLLAIGLFLVMWRFFRPLAGQGEAPPTTNVALPPQADAVAEVWNAINALRPDVARHTLENQAVEHWYPEVIKALNANASAVASLELSSGSMTTEVIAMGKAVTAMSRIRLFEYFASEVERRDAQAEGSWTDFSKVFFHDGPYDSEDWQRLYATRRAGWESNVRELETLCADAFGDAPSMLTHPNYDLNAHRPAPLDDLIVDPAIRQEYRRACDQHETYEATAVALRAKVASEINQAQNIVFARGAGRDL